VQQERGVAIITALIAFVYAAAVPASRLVHTDQLAYLGTIQRMKAGQGYYSAYVDSYLQDTGIRMGRARAFREPAMFWIWRVVPSSALFAVFLALMVLTTCLLAKLALRPATAIVPGVFLIAASRTTITEWLLVEFWALPLLAGALLAWKRERWWTAAALAATAVCLRESAAPLLLAGLVLALWKRKPWQPWVTCGAAAFAFFAVHFVIAAQHTQPNGNDAALSGTGKSLSSVLGMMTWPFPNQPLIALVLVALWGLGIARLVSSRDSLPVAGLLAIPLLGLDVSRGYWGLLATPFALWLACDAIAAGWRSARTRLLV
jgi:hypothetical protein